MKSAFASLASLAVVLACVSARAEIVGRDFYPPTLPLPEDAHVDDGFYLRVALGVGGLTSQDDANGVTNGSSEAVHAGGGAFEASIGGGPQRGLVVAGTLFAQAAEFGKVTSNDGSSTLTKSASLALLGATLDMYPDPRSGFHFSATMGPAFFTTTDDDAIHRQWHTSAGGGVSTAAGYDWWVADQWSLGFLVRATGARLWGTTSYDAATDKTTSDPTSRRSVATLSVLFSALFR
jgi:hypothetical protein